MAKPFHELLAGSLSRAEKKAKDGIIRSKDIARRDRERLLKSGWLQQIITGWYLLVSPQVMQGESTVWFASFWTFIQQYLTERFFEDYCLSAESSLDIHTAENVIPHQVVVITNTGGNYTLSLPHHTGILIYQDVKKFPHAIESKNKLQIMPLGLALCRVTKSFFQRQSMTAKIALLMLQDPSELNRHLLQGGMVQAAGRLAAAYQQLRKDDFTQAIVHTMQSAGFTIELENPFVATQINNIADLGSRITSPYYARIISLWENMRNDVINHFPKRQKTKGNAKSIIQRIEDVYVNDAYHSLSIEGYKVTKSLIEKIKTGNWNPDLNQSDLEQQNALAAKGYYLAFLTIKKSINDILSGLEAETIIKRDLSVWYQALFSPSVEAGLIKPVHLAGYRDDRVFIRHSLHVPPPKEAVLDCMDAFFSCLKNEENPIVRAVLGHFIFVFIHPYRDGNGRIGRFLMNVLWSTASYPWTIVRLEARKKYLESLETASVNKNIIPFTIFLCDEMSVKW